MAAIFPDPAIPIDTIETQINKFCDKIIMCVNARRMTLLATVQETRNAKIERSFLFRGEYGHLEQLIANIGEVWEEELPAVPRYEAMRPTIAFGKMGKAPGDIWHPHAVGIDRNTNHIYVIEGCVFPYFPRISIFSNGGEFLSSCANEQMECPHGIAIHTDNLYVTDIGKHAVFQFKIETDLRLVAKFGKKGTGIGEFDLPSNLAVSINGDVYVADYTNNRIQIIDNSLHYIRTLSEHPIQLPRDIKLTVDSVFVLCEDSPCIRVFSHTGDMLRSLITRGDKLQVNDAMFLCLDAQGNIIISDYGANNVKVFSKDGKLICTIGRRREGIGKFVFPQGITLSNELNLVVVSWNVNYGLQIFSYF